MTQQTFLDCQKRIQSFIHNTPVLRSQLINEIVKADISFKCENFQKMGAFKIRGALNAIMQLSEKQKENGVVTHSSGNFAQAVSLAAKNLGVKAYIVMPSSAPKVKQEAVLGYDGMITICEPTLEAREEIFLKIQQETGATFIHPSNDLNVIVGNSIACLELLEIQNDLDIIVTPVGGGGLLAGTAIAAHFFGNNCKVIGAEPFEADDAYRSLISGKIETNTSTNTIADGLKTQLGNHNFPIIQKHVQSIIRVTEDEIIDAMKLVYERMKIIIEPSSAAAIAAVIREKEKFQNKKVGIIISGGNVDLTKLPF
jgi:threonine dehydratase